MEPIDQLTPDALVAHGAFVLSLARGLTRDESSALDLRQDAMVSALQSPPKDRSVRGWFSTVLKSRKIEQDRSEGARRGRESTVARPEVLVRDSAAQLEQLELNHSVVRAVLDLEEPYRSVVMDVYFEGLTPDQISKQRGIKAGTIRSQLCRAHDQLRAKLDRQYRERHLWAVPFLGMLERERAAATSATEGSALTAAHGTTVAPGVGSPLVLAATALCAGGVLLAAFGLHAPARENAAPVGVEPATGAGGASVAAVESELEAPAALRANRGTFGTSQGGSVTGDTPALPLEEIADLLEQARALRSEILKRAMVVDPELQERFEPLENEGGVVRLLNRERYGVDWSVPGMRGGGGFYSFAERSRDARDKPQISFIEERLILETQHSACLPLGRIPLGSVPTTPVWKGPTMNELDAIEFKVVWADRSVGSKGGLALKDHRASLMEVARAHGALDDAGASRFAFGSRRSFVEPKVGESYLLRSIGEREFDHLVAFEVLALDGEGCTLAWRLLKQWPVAAARTSKRDRASHEGVAIASPELIELTRAQLHGKLEQVIDRARRTLFDSHAADIEESYGSLRDQEGCGLARLLVFESQWTELVSGNGHGAEISPLTGAYDDEHAYLGYRGDPGDGELTPSLSCSVGMVCDLGAIPQGEVTLHSLSSQVDEKVKIAVDPWFGFSPPSPSDPNEASWDVDSYWLGVGRGLAAQLEEGGMRAHAKAVIGHTYLVRSVNSLERNLLFAVHVADVDEYGVIVTWRILDDRDPWPYR